MHTSVIFDIICMKVWLIYVITRTEYVVIEKMKLKKVLTFDDIKHIIDRSKETTHKFIMNMIEKQLIKEISTEKYTLVENK